MPLVLGAKLLLEAKGAFTGYGRVRTCRNKNRGPLSAPAWWERDLVRGAIPVAQSWDL